MDSSSADETRIFDKDSQVKDEKDETHSKHQGTGESCPEAEKEASGATVTSPIKRKSQLKTDDEAKRKRIESNERKKCDDKYSTDISDAKVATIKDCSEKSKATFKNTAVAADEKAIKYEKITNPSDQLTIHKDISELSEIFSSPRTTRTSVIQTRSLSKKLDQSKIDLSEESNSSTPAIRTSVIQTRSSSRKRDQSEIDLSEQTLKKEIGSSTSDQRGILSSLVTEETKEKSENMTVEEHDQTEEKVGFYETKQVCIKSEKQAFSDTTISMLVESKSETEVQDKVNQSTNIEQKECADEAIADISRALHNVLKVDDSKKCTETSISSAEASSDNVKEITAKMQKHADKSSIKEKSEISKAKTDPAVLPIAIFASPSKTEAQPQIEGLAARMLLNVKISTSQRKTLKSSDDIDHSKGSQYKKRRSENSNVTSDNSRTEMSDTVREMTDMQHSLSGKSISKDKEELPQKHELLVPDKPQKMKSPRKVVSFETSPKVPRSRMDINESENQDIAKTCEPALLEVLPQCETLTISNNPRMHTHDTRASSAGSFETQSTLLHPIYSQPESKYVPIELFHKDVAFVESQKQILASYNETNAAQTHHSDQISNLGNEAQEIASPIEIGQIAKSDPLLPVENLSASKLSPSKDSKSECAAFREYPGLADEPAKVKKDARYQKKFYKKKPVTLPCDWKEDRISSSELEQSTNFEENQSKVIENAPLTPPEVVEHEKVKSLEDESLIFSQCVEDEKNKEKSHLDILPQTSCTVEDKMSSSVEKSADFEENQSKVIENAPLSPPEVVEHETVKSLEDNSLTFSQCVEDEENKEKSHLDILPQMSCTVEDKMSSSIEESKLFSTDSCKSIKITAPERNDSQSAERNLCQLEGLAARIVLPGDGTSSSKKDSDDGTSSSKKDSDDGTSSLKNEHDDETLLFEGMRWVSFSFNHDLIVDENSIFFRDIHDVTPSNTSTGPRRLIPYLTLNRDINPMDNKVYSIEEMYEVFIQTRKMFFIKDPRQSGWEFGLPLPTIPIRAPATPDDSETDDDDDSKSVNDDLKEIVKDKSE